MTMVIERSSTNAETHEAERVVQAVISLTKKDKEKDGETQQ